MTNYLGSIDKILLLPIRSVGFIEEFSGSTQENDFALYEIEKESAYSVLPILRADDGGGQRTIGYKVEATIYTPHNKFSSNGLMAKLERFAKKSKKVTNPNDDNHYHIVLSTGTAISLPELKGGSLNSTGKQTITLCNLNGNVSLNWAIESVEYRPRMKISITSNFKNYSYLIGV